MVLGAVAGRVGSFAKQAARLLPLPLPLALSSINKPSALSVVRAAHVRMALRARAPGIDAQGRGRAVGSAGPRARSWWVQD